MRELDVLFVSSDARIFHPRHYWLMARGARRGGLRVAVMGQPSAAQPTTPPVPALELPRRSTRATRMLSGPVTMLRALRQRSAVLQVNSLDLLPWAVAARVVSRRRIVYDSNEDYPAYMLMKEWLPRSMRRFVAQLVSYLEPRLAGRLDAVTLADDSTAERFRDHCQRVLVLRNFPWLEDLADASSATKHLPPRVIYHGSASAAIVDRFLAAAASSKERGLECDWQFVARELTAAQRQALVARVADVDLGDTVSLRFDVPFDEMGAVLAEATVGLIPLPDTAKFRNNIPRKMFEFMALGIPFVATDLPPIRRLVGDRRCCILIDAAAPASSYADGVAELIADIALARRLGTFGRKVVREQFSAERETASYVDLLRSLTSV